MDYIDINLFKMNDVNTIIIKDKLWKSKLSQV